MFRKSLINLQTSKTCDLLDNTANYPSSKNPADCRESPSRSPGRPMHRWGRSTEERPDLPDCEGPSRECVAQGLATGGQERESPRTRAKTEAGMRRSRRVDGPRRKARPGRDEAKNREAAAATIPAGGKDQTSWKDERTRAGTSRKAAEQRRTAPKTAEADVRDSREDSKKHHQTAAASRCKEGCVDIGAPECAHERDIRCHLYSPCAGCCPSWSRPQYASD